MTLEIALVSAAMLLTGFIVGVIAAFLITMKQTDEVVRENNRNRRRIHVLGDFAAAISNSGYWDLLRSQLGSQRVSDVEEIISQSEQQQQR